MYMFDFVTFINATKPVNILTTFIVKHIQNLSKICEIINFNIIAEEISD